MSTTFPRAVTEPQHIDRGPLTITVLPSLRMASSLASVSFFRFAAQKRSVFLSPSRSALAIHGAGVSSNRAKPLGKCGVCASATLVMATRLQHKNALRVWRKAFRKKKKEFIIEE
jgi:hypothetical protein